MDEIFFQKESLKLLSKHNSVRINYPHLVGQTHYGVRIILPSMIDKDNSKVLSIVPFQVAFDKNHGYKGSYRVYKVTKKGKLYINPTDYGWDFFSNLSDAEAYVKSLKRLFQSCIDLKIKELQELRDSLN